MTCLYLGLFIRGGTSENAGHIEEASIADHTHIDGGHTHDDTGHTHKDRGHSHKDPAHQHGIESSSDGLDIVLKEMIIIYSVH